MLLRTFITVFTLLFIAGYFASGWYGVYWAGARANISLASGKVTWELFGSEAPPAPLFMQSLRFASLRPPHVLQLDVWKSMNLGLINGIHCEVALWPMPAVLAATCAFWHWRGSQRNYGPGRCRKCGYDLTGNVSGQCPECGRAIEAQRS